MTATADAFTERLIASRLMPPETARALRARWQAVGRDPGNADLFAAWLVRGKHLTDYQVRRLREGSLGTLFLGPYRVLERIGQGRSAGVFRAVGLDGRPVALKVLPPSKSRETEAAGRFEREIRLALRLNHPNVVRTLDCGDHQGVRFLVMEYLEGQTLEELLRERGRLPPREAVRCGFLAALGLQHLHEQGLVHRDVKPGNLMLAPAPGPEENTLRSMVKLLDLGLGRAQFDDESRTPQEQLTADGAVLGTLDYLAPEQARDPQRVDIRADIYGLGCTLYHALAGQAPFADTNMVRQIMRHATQQARPLGEVNSEVRPPLAAAVERLMAKYPEGRPATPREAAALLRECL